MHGIFLHASSGFCIEPWGFIESFDFCIVSCFCILSPVEVLVCLLQVAATNTKATITNKIDNLDFINMD